MGKLNFSDVKFWLGEAEAAERRQKAELIQKHFYPHLIKYYEGRMFIDPADGSVASSQTLAVINEYFPNTNSIISDTMYQNPDIIAEPSKPTSDEGAPIMKSALGYGWDKTDALIENRVGLFDMIYAGYCAIEVDQVQSPDNEVMPLGEEPKEGMVKKVLNAFGKASTELEADEAQAKTEPPIEENYASSQMTYVRRWNPLNILFDWKAERFKDSRYLIKKIWMSQAQFEAKYPKFKGKVSSSSESEYASQEGMHALHNKRILLYEFQIKKQNNQYVNLVVAPNYQMEEIDMWVRPYTTNGFNVKIGTLHKYGKIYPIPIAANNKKVADEMNEYVAHEMEVAERNIPKRWVNKNNVKEEGIAALNSDLVNDLVLLDGGAESVGVVQHTSVSNENKEVIALLQTQKEKNWSVSSTRLAGQGQAKFATELDIQEAGFQSKQADIQEGLRDVIKQQLETMKDLIVTFWDDAVFLKITDKEKPEWYEPILDPQTGRVINPLADILTGDYFINVDISSALRPNKQRKQKELVEFMGLLLQEGVQMFMQSQGVSLNIDILKKVATEFGMNPESLFIQAPQQEQLPQEGVPDANIPVPV